MADTVFKTQQPTVEAKAEAKPMVAPEETRAGDETNIEVPYLDYEQTHPTPYLADYFKLGDRWNDPQGGFPKEMEAMGKFIENKVKSGELANSQKAVNKLLKDMEKTNNLNHEERSVIKIEVLRNYMEFISKNDDVKRNANIYANSQSR